VEDLRLADRVLRPSPFFGNHGNYLQRILIFVVFGGFWCLLITHLSLCWGTDPQYSFGWFGPVLCGFLFLLRWFSRPPTLPASSLAAKWAFWTAGFAFLPTWLVEQANPDWRLISWLLTLEIAALSLGAIYFLGGRSWVRHFAFSIFFIFTVVPWPLAAELFVTQGLMHAATWATVQSLHLFRISALQHGNLIEVKTGLLGIDEACSGIRSFQATLMVSLFLGELYRGNRQQRCSLVVFGVLLAFLCNVGRTFLLSWIAAEKGVGAVPIWHDSAGFAILGICFLVLWGIAHLLLGAPQPLECSSLAAPMTFPRRQLFGLGAWLLFSVLGTEVWYRAHETGTMTGWSFKWPVMKDNFSDLGFADPLGDERRAASWTDEDGSRWMAFFFRWAAGPPRSRILARMHRPEICLPATGYRLRMDRGTLTIRAKELNIPFRALDFDYYGQEVYVFYCLWEDRHRDGEHPRIRDHWDNRLIGLESVVLGERNLGQQSLEVVICGYASPEEAERALRRQMEVLIQTSEPPPSPLSRQLPPSA
jgi:exosortase